MITVWSPSSWRPRIAVFGAALHRPAGPRHDPSRLAGGSVRPGVVFLVAYIAPAPGRRHLARAGPADPTSSAARPQRRRWSSAWPGPDRPGRAQPVFNAATPATCSPAGSSGATHLAAGAGHGRAARSAGARGLGQSPDRLGPAFDQAVRDAGSGRDRRADDRSRRLRRAPNAANRRSGGEVPMSAATSDSRRLSAIPTTTRPRLECGVFGVFDVREAARRHRAGPARPAAPRPGSLRHRLPSTASASTPSGTWARSATPSAAST